MKNQLLAVIFSLASLNANAISDTYELKHLSSSKDKFSQWFTTIEFKQTLSLSIRENGLLEDDLYFQDGKRVEEVILDKDRLFCKLDTEPEYDSTRKSIAAGEKRIIRIAEEEINFDTKTYGVDIEISSSEYDFIDELECEVPLSKIENPLIISDLMRTMGDYIKIDFYLIENSFHNDTI